MSFFFTGETYAMQKIQAKCSLCSQCNPTAVKRKEYIEYILKNILPYGPEYIGNLFHSPV